MRPEGAATAVRLAGAGLGLLAVVGVSGAAGSTATLRQERRTLTVPTCERVVVDTVGSVTVVGTAAPTLAVTASLQGVARDDVVAGQYLDRIRWFAEAAGPTTVRIGVDPRGAKVLRRGAPAGSDGVRVDLRLEMPRGATVSVVTTDGDVSVTGVAAVDSQLTSGTTRVGDIAGAAYLQARQGRIDARGVRGELQVATGVGGVSVVGARGEVRIRTGGGAVTVADCPRGATVSNRQGRVDIRRTGNVTVEAQSSSILVEDVGGRADLVTRNGRISVRRLAGDSLFAKTDTGAIEVSQPVPTATRYDLRTRNGRIDVLMAPTASLDVAMTSTLGRVQCRLPLDRQRPNASAHAVYGSLGTGRYRLDAHSQTGMVRLLPIR